MAMNRDRRRHDQSRLWMALAVAGVVLTLVLGALLTDRAPREAALWDQSRGTTSLTYDGAIWAPRGQPVDFPESAMVVVGRTAERYDLFANRQEGYPEGGGGGGRIEATQRWGRVYLKTVDGRYQPLVQSSFTREKGKQELRR